MKLLIMQFSPLSSYVISSSQNFLFIFMNMYLDLYRSRGWTVQPIKMITTTGFLQ
jgi:hypothetical protein